MKCGPSCSRWTWFRIALLAATAAGQEVEFFADFSCSTTATNTVPISDNQCVQIDGIAWKSFYTGKNIGLLAFYNQDVTGKTCQAGSQDGLHTSMNVGWIEGCHSLNGDAAAVTFKSMQFIPATDTLPVVNYVSTTAGVGVKPASSDPPNAPPSTTTKPAPRPSSSSSRPFSPTSSSPAGSAISSALESTYPNSTGTFHLSLTQSSVTNSTLSSGLSASNTSEADLPQDQPTLNSDSAHSLAANSQSSSSADQQEDGEPETASGMSLGTKTVVIAAGVVGVGLLLLAGLFLCLRSRSRRPSWRGSDNPNMFKVQPWLASSEKPPNDAMDFVDGYPNATYDHTTPVHNPPYPDDMITYSSSYLATATQSSGDGSASPTSSQTSFARPRVVPLSTLPRGRKTSTVLYPKTIRPKEKDADQLDERTLWTSTIADDRQTLPAETFILPIGSGFGKRRNAYSPTALQPRSQEALKTSIFQQEDAETVAETNWDSVSERAAKNRRKKVTDVQETKRSRKASGLYLSEAFMEAKD